MSFTNPAQRDWHQANHEATHTLDARYGTGHRPAYARTGAGWTSACGCPSPSCDRAYDACLYPTWHDALDAARINLTLAEHGPGAGTEAS